MEDETTPAAENPKAPRKRAPRKKAPKAAKEPKAPKAKPAPRVTEEMEEPSLDESEGEPPHPELEEQDEDPDVFVDVQPTVSLEELNRELAEHGAWALARPATLFDGDSVQMTFRHVSGKHAAVSLNPRESSKHPVDRIKAKLDKLAANPLFSG